jgi:hypothetical protein
MRAFLKLTLEAAGRCIVKILVYYIPMRKDEFAAGLVCVLRADLWADIVGLRAESGKNVSHA